MNIQPNVKNTLSQILFLPTSKQRQGEGGLRTKNYFKTSTQEQPLITIVTVVFNNASYLEQTIKSVIEQTYDNVEYIIIDGGSTDETLDIIKKYDEQIDYWVSEKDNGIYDAMNKAIHLSTGIWLNFMNAGDLFTNSHVLSHTMQYTNTDKAIIYSDLYLYNEKNTINKKITCDVEKLILVHQAMIYKRTLHESHGLYLVKKGLTISDYLFFNLLDKNSFIKSPYPISKNLIGGISYDIGHIRQKFAIDYLFNNMGLIKMVLHVIYALFKRVFFNK